MEGRSRVQHPDEERRLKGGNTVELQVGEGGALPGSKLRLGERLEIAMWVRSGSGLGGRGGALAEMSTGEKAEKGSTIDKGGLGPRLGSSQRDGSR